MKRKDKETHSSREKFAIITIGCPKNEIDSESMASILRRKGLVQTEDFGEASLAIVNSCAFIDPAKEESIEVTLSLAELKRKGKLRKLLVAGCLAQRYGESLLAEISEIDAVLGTGTWSRVGDAVDSILESAGKFACVAEPGGSFGGALRESREGRVSAYLKIAEGCDNRCSYCVIPSLRGGFKSRPIEDILEEARKLEREGVKEVSLISNDTGCYGMDIYGKSAVVDLISKLERIEGLQWIRLLYVHPATISDELLNTIAVSKRVCHYLDIPIQHISSRILERMGRRMRGEELITLLEKVREKIPGVTLRTSVIVGFPGESEKEFQELLTFIEKFKFERLGAFSYSREEETPSSSFEDHLSEEVKQERVDRVMELQMMISSETNESLKGKVVRVLMERQEGEVFVGRMNSQAPQVDGIVRVMKEGSFECGFRDVRIELAEAYDLAGVFVEKTQGKERSN